MISTVIVLFTTTIVLFNPGSVQGDCSRCAECNVGTNLCVHCPSGHWGFECDRACSSEMCLNDRCEPWNGLCSYGCIDGYYPLAVSRGMSCLPCPENCTRCWRGDYCTECVTGKFGDQCQHTCDLRCDTCTESWSGATHGKCLTCPNDLTGSVCAYDCSLCKDGLCENEHCTLGKCIDGYHYYNNQHCVRCYTTCSTCNEFSYNDKKCLTCPKGTWGDLCTKACPALCTNLTCDQDTGTCVCLPGSFMGTQSTCIKCPANCQECTSVSQCTVCVDGYYGNSCNNICSSVCVSCDQTSQNCTKCVVGQFLRDSTCQECDDGCPTCKWMPQSNNSECDSCLDGYRRDRLEDGLIFKCFKCPPGCIQCNKNYECQGCYPGYYTFLHTCCPDNCIGCKSSTDCTKCKQGYYGKTCSERCHRNCKTCSASNTCNECFDGRYGSVMEYNKNYCECKGSECSSFDSIGKCIACKSAGWVPRYTGCCECHFCKNNDCDPTGTCKQGCKYPEYHGKNCSIPCKETIQYCVTCISGPKTVRCTKCLPYTTYLTNEKCESCPRKCNGFICGKDGYCSNGCWDHWTGPKCDINCDERCIGNCNKTFCDACKPGYHGDVCSYSCGEKCVTNMDGTPLCNKFGICLQCVPGYFGTDCNSLCSDRCAYQLCDRQSGDCTKGCVGHFYGERCEIPCSSNCFSLSCSDLNGTCLHGCAVGYKGERCNEGPTSGNIPVQMDNYFTGAAMLIFHTLHMNIFSYT